MFNDKLWLSEPFTKAQAWIDLIFLAHWKDEYKYVRGNKIKVNRGEVSWSLRDLSKRWKWSVNKTVRYIKELENDKQLNTQNSKLSNRYYIVNYELYQGDGYTNEYTDEHTDEYKNKEEVKEVKNIYKEKIYKKETGNGKFIIPSLEEIKEYCLQRKNGVDANTFYNFYESKGWMIGKNKMKNWKAAIHTWEKNKKQKGESEWQ